MCNQQKQCPRRRFFKHFKERVRGVRIHFLGAVDNDYPPAALARRQRHRMPDRADFIDRDDRLHALAVIRHTAFDDL